MTKEIVVIGAGGFGREVLDVIESINTAGENPRWNVRGVVDDSPSRENLARLEARQTPFLGALALLARVSTPTHYTIGIGTPTIRRTIVEQLSANANLVPATLIHPTSSAGFGVSIAEGSVVCAGVRLTTNISVGAHTHLNLNVTVGHDTKIGNFTSINPAAAVSGDCSIGSEVLIGVGAVILQRLSVGNKATVGASACVTRNVPDETLVKGVPAR